MWKYLLSAFIILTFTFFVVVLLGKKNIKELWNKPTLKTYLLSVPLGMLVYIVVGKLLRLFQFFNKLFCFPVFNQTIQNRSEGMFKKNIAVYLKYHYAEILIKIIHPLTRVIHMNLIKFIWHLFLVLFISIQFSGSSEISPLLVEIFLLLKKYS